MPIGDIIRQRVDIDNDIWRETMGSKSESLKRYAPDLDDSTVDKTWHWLVDTCAKTLGEKMALDQWNEKGNANYDLFMKQVEKSFNRKKTEIIDAYKLEIQGNVDS